MSQWLNLGQLATRAGKLLPTITNLISWLQIPTADGKTLANSKGVDADLTDVNCLQFSNNNGQFVALPVETPFAVGVILSADVIITGDSGGVAEAIFGEDSNHCFGVTAGSGDRYPRFRANTIANYIEFTNITVSENTPYNIKWERTAAGEVVCTVVDLVTNTTQTQTANNFTGQQEAYLNTTDIKEIGRSGVNIDSHIKISNAKVGDYFYPLQEGSGTKVYDISGNGNHGVITSPNWSTADGFGSWNHEYGFDASAVFDTGDYIQTGVTASYDHSIEATFRYTGDTSLDLVLFGVRDNSRDFYFGLQGGEWRCGRSTGTATDEGTVDNAVHKITISADGVFTLSNEDGSNPIELANITHPTYTFIRDYYINGRNLDGSPSKVADVEFYSFKIMNGSTTVLDYNFIENNSTEDYNLIRYPALNTKTKQVVTFDGVDDGVVTEPVTLGNNFEFEWTGSLSDAEYFGRIIANKNSTNNEGLFELFRNATADSLRFAIYPNGGSRQESAYIAFNFDGSVKTHKVTYNNGALTYVVDDVTLYSNTFSAGNGFTDSDAFAIYSRPNGGNNCAGTLQNFKLTISGSTAFEYDFQSYIGTTTVKDLSTNNNDGTATIGTADINTGAGGLAEFWGTRVADASGSLVSADYATGNTSISNPAGFVHNNSECGVKLRSRTVGTFDGAADRLDFTAHTTAVGDVFDFEFDLVSNADDANGSHRCLLSNRITRYIALRDNDDGRIVVRGDSIQNSTGTIKVADGMSTLKVTIDSTSQVSVSINGGSAETLSTNFTGVDLDRLMAAGATNLRYLNANVKSFSITNSSGTKVVDYDFQNDIGTNTVQDLTANNNDGDLTVGSGGTETFWADNYQEYEKIDLDQGFVPAQITVTDCTDTSLNGLYELDSTRNNDKLRWLKNNNTAQKVYFNSGSNRWTIQDSGGSVTKVGDTILPAEGSYGNGANLAYSTQGVFIKTSGTNITQIGQYDGDEVLTATEATLNDRYFG